MQSSTPRGRGRGRGRGQGQFGRGRGHGFKRARRGSRGFRGGDRGGYKGSGVPLTPVEPGFRYFKKSFMENPWHDLERQHAAANVNPEEIEVDIDEHDAADEAPDVDVQKEKVVATADVTATVDEAKPLKP